MSIRNGLIIVQKSMKNEGKKFEQAIKDSCPNYVLVHRLRDAAQSFNPAGGNLRFSLKSPFDYIMWDSKHHILYAIELKTVDKKSISFERDRSEKGEIHHHQIINLTKWNAYSGVCTGLLIEFRPIKTTIFVPIDEFNVMVNKLDKKSFNYSDLEKYSVHYLKISQNKIRTRYRYDMESFFDSNFIYMEEDT